MEDYDVVAVLDSDNGDYTMKFAVALAESHSDASKRAQEMIIRAEGCPVSAIKTIKTTVRR